MLIILMLIWENLINELGVLVGVSLRFFPLLKRSVLFLFIINFIFRTVLEKNNSSLSKKIFSSVLLDLR